MIKIELTTPVDFTEFSFTKMYNDKDYNKVASELFNDALTDDDKYDEAIELHRNFLISIVNFSFTKFLIFKSLQFLFLMSVLVSLSSLFIAPLYFVLSIVFLILANNEKKYHSSIEKDIDLLKMVIADEKSKK